MKDSKREREEEYKGYGQIALTDTEIDEISERTHSRSLHTFVGDNVETKNVKENATVLGTALRTGKKCEIATET